jgi:hypothetical protein
MFDHVVDTDTLDASMFTIKGKTIQSVSADVWDSKGVILVTDSLVKSGESISITGLKFLTTDTTLTTATKLGDIDSYDLGTEALNDATFSGQDIVIQSTNGGTFDSKSIIDPVIYGDFGQGLNAFKKATSSVSISGGTVTLTPVVDITSYDLMVCLTGLKLSNGRTLLDDCSNINSGILSGGEDVVDEISAWSRVSNSWDSKTSKLTVKWSSTISSNANVEYLNISFKDTADSNITVTNPSLVSTTANLDGSSTVTMDSTNIQLYNPGGIPSGDFDYEFSFNVPGGNFANVTTTTQLLTTIDPDETAGSAFTSEHGFGVGDDPGAEVSDVGVTSLDVTSKTNVELNFSPVVNDVNSTGNLALLIEDDQGQEVLPSKVLLTDTDLDDLDGVSISGNYIILSRGSGMTSDGGYYTITFDMSSTTGDEVTIFSSLVTDPLDPANTMTGASTTETGVIGSWGEVAPDPVGFTSITVTSMDASSLDMSVSLGDDGLPSSDYLAFTLASVENSNALIAPNGADVESTVFSHSGGAGGTLGFSSTTDRYYFYHNSDIATGMDIAFVPTGDFEITSGDVVVTVYRMSKGVDGVVDSKDDSQIGDAVSGTVTMDVAPGPSDVLGAYIYNDVNETVLGTDVSTNEVIVSFDLESEVTLTDGKFRVYIMQDDLSQPYTLTSVNLVTSNLSCGEGVTATLLEDGSAFEVECSGDLEQVNYSDGISLGAVLAFDSGPSSSDNLKLGLMAIDANAQQIGNVLMTNSLSVGLEDSLGISDQVAGTPVSGSCELDDSSNPPFLLYTSPLHNVDVNSTIELYFNECLTLNENDVKLKSGDQDLDFGVTMTSSENGFDNESVAVLQITPDSDLPANSPIALYIKSAVDADDNSIPINSSVNIRSIDTPVFVLDLFTGGAADFTFDFGNPPWLVGTAPKLDRVVSRNSKFILAFNESLDSVSVSNSGNFVVKNLDTNTVIDPDYYDVRLLSVDRSVLSIVPTVPKGSNDTPLWPANSTVEITVGPNVQSEFGFSIGGEGISLAYTVNGASDNTAPTINGAISGYASTAADFASGTFTASISTPSISLKPSEPLDPFTTLNGFSCSDGVDCGFEYDVEENTIHVFFENVKSSSVGDTFTLSSNGVKDLSGNAMSNASASVEFTAALNDDVTIVDYYANNAEIMVQFSQLMNSSTLSLTNSLLNKALYTITDANSSQEFDKTNMVIDYDVPRSRLYLRGIDMFGSDRVKIEFDANILPKFGNGALEASSLVMDVEGQDFFGANFDKDVDQNHWQTPVFAEPLNKFVGYESGVLHVEMTLGEGQTIEDGDQLTVTLPQGFTVNNSVGPDAYSPFSNNMSLNPSKSLTFDTSTEPESSNTGAAVDDGVYSTGNRIIVRFDTEDTFTEGDTVIVDIAGINNSTIGGSYEFGLKMLSSPATSSILKYNLLPLSFDLFGGETQYIADVQVIGDSTLSGDSVTIVARTHAGEISKSATFNGEGIADFNIEIPTPGEFEVFVSNQSVGSNGTFRAPTQPLRMYIDENHDELRSINLTKWGTSAENQEVTVTVGPFNGDETGVYEIFARNMHNFFGEKINLENDISDGYVTKTMYLPVGYNYQVGFEPSVEFDFGTSTKDKAQSFGDVYPSAPVAIKTNEDGCFENSGTDDDCEVSIVLQTNSISVNVEVVDESAVALSNSTVCFDNPDNRIGICETFSGGSGVIKLPSAGSYNAVAFKSGLPSKSTSFLVNANGSVTTRGSVLNTVTFKISKTNKTTVGFKVVDSDGNPYNDAFVSCFGTMKPIFNDMRVDSNGRATMWLPKSTSYTCEAFVDGYGLIADMSITLGTDPLTNKIFRPANTIYTLSGTITSGDAQDALENVYVYVFDPSGRFSNGTSTDQNGDYTLQVPEGSYVIGAMDEGNLISESQVGVSSNTTKDINVSGDKYEVTFVVSGSDSANGFVHAAGSNGVAFKEFKNSKKIVMNLFAGTYKLDALFNGKVVNGVTKVSGTSTYDATTTSLVVNGDSKFNFVFATGQTVNFDIANAGTIAYVEVFGNGIHSDVELSNGSGSLSLPNGFYNYRIHSPGKIPLKGTFLVSDASVDVTGSILSPDVTIKGTVTVDGSASDNQVFVWGEPTNGGRSVTTVADDDGAYTLAAKNNTTYTVKTVQPGFEPLTQTVAIVTSSVTGKDFDFDSDDAADFDTKTSSVSSGSGGVVAIDGLGSTTITSGAVDEDVTVKLQEVSPPATDGDTTFAKAFEVTLTKDDGSAETAFDAAVKYDIELTGADLDSYETVSELVDQNIKYYTDGRWVTEETTVTLYGTNGSVLDPLTAAYNEIDQAIFSTTTNHATVFGLGSETGESQPEDSGDEGGGDEGGDQGGGDEGVDSGGSSRAPSFLRGLLGIGERKNVPTFEPAEIFTTEKIDLAAIMLARFPKSLGQISDSNVVKESFSDTKNHWGAKYIASLRSVGIVEGYADGTYKPDQVLTRAELLKIAMVANGLDNRYLTITDTGFSDVPSNHWAATAVYRAQQFEIIDGYADGTFKPNAIVTRAEAAKVLMLASAKAIQFGSATQSVFSDVSSNDWFFQIANAAYNQGIIKGIDGKFEAARSVTRAEVAAMVVRSINSSAVAFAGSQS